MNAVKQAAHNALRSKAARAAAIVAVGFAAAAAFQSAVTAPHKAATRFAGATSSQPLALTADDAFLAVANPDSNSVTFFDVRNDANRRLAEVPVQSEPQGVAFLPDGKKLYVANAVSGTVSVIKANIANGVIHKANKHIVVGTEPYGLALTPNGRKLYVSNARSNSVSVIDTQTDQVIKTIEGVGFEPRGIAITNDGDDDDNDETVYVTQFLSAPIAGKVDGFDDAKAGHVSVISTATDSVTGDVTLNPIADTGFFALGDALGASTGGVRTPPGPDFVFPTGAYPNQLNNIAVKGMFAFVPNTGASPNGPFRFDVNTHSLLSVIDRGTHLDAGRTINMHTAVRDQPVQPKTFITLPWAIAFKHLYDEAFVISAASNIVVKLVVDPVTGTASVQRDPANPDRVLQVKVGKNPRGIVVNSSDTRAFVANYVSRDVSVIDLHAAPEAVIATLPASALPQPGTLADKIHIGKELYNTSIGEFDPAPNTMTPITGRMSNNGWGACAACHTPFATSDNVVWIFPSGPKRTLPQHTDFDKSDAARSQMRLLNWSGERDEEEDFELNIRAVSGGAGLIVLADGSTTDPAVFNLVAAPPAVSLASGDRNQLKVRGVNAWDAIETFEQFGIRAPISPLSQADPDVIAGRALFTSANCQSCHGTAQWTTSRVDFAQPAPPPPNPAEVVKGQLIAQLRNVGTFDPNAPNEVNQLGAPAIGGDGFVPPSLLSLHAFAQSFFHNGLLTSLDQVMDNVTHRSAGTGGVDTLTNPADRAKVVKFVLSIDSATPPVNP